VIIWLTQLVKSKLQIVNQEQIVSRMDWRIGRHIRYTKLPIWDADPLPILDDFPDESLLIVSVCYPTPWFANIVNFLVASVFPPLASRA